MLRMRSDVNVAMPHFRGGNVQMKTTLFFASLVIRVVPRCFGAVSGVLQNGHSAYILQGNLFHDFLEELT
jgi:hypothetical protein